MFRPTSTFQQIAQTIILPTGVETKFKGEFYEVLLCVSHVPELKRMEEQEGGLLVGAAVSLNTLKHKLSEMINKLPGESTLACRLFKRASVSSTFIQSTRQGQFLLYLKC